MIRFKINELLYKTDYYKKHRRVKTFKEISDELGIAPNTITRLVRGCENTSTKNIETFMTYFKLTPDQWSQLIEIVLPKKTKKKAKSKKILGLFI